MALAQVAEPTHLWLPCLRLGQENIRWQQTAMLEAMKRILYLCRALKETCFVCFSGAEP